MNLISYYIQQTFFNTAFEENLRKSFIFNREALGSNNSSGRSHMSQNSRTFKKLHMPTKIISFRPDFFLKN